MWIIYSAVQQMPGSTGHGAAEFKHHNAKNFAISFTSFMLTAVVAPAVFSKTRKKTL
jgi:hypothetical protein